MASRRPRNSWAMMSPLLPREESNAARAIAVAVVGTWAVAVVSMSDAMPRIVSTMLVPVSPSGTGKTFRALSWF